MYNMFGEETTSFGLIKLWWIIGLPLVLFYFSIHLTKDADDTNFIIFPVFGGV